VITGRTEARLQSVLNEFQNHNENMLIHVGDVVNYEGNINLIKKIIKYFGRLDVLINNAGVSTYGELEMLNCKVVDELINTNVKGAIFLYKAAISELKRTKGSVLFISSIAGFRGLPGYSIYSLSKMALTALTQSIRIENKTSGVFIGIAYVSFTENETNKSRLSVDGKLELIPKRNSRFVQSREATGKMLLHQIARKVPESTHSFIGKLSLVLCKYLPSIVNLMLTRNYQKQAGSNN
jgi:short-subunit dehydrogenase